jgi:uncharacterized protein
MISEERTVMFFRFLISIGLLISWTFAAIAQDQEIPQACQGNNLLTALEKANPAAADAIRKEAEGTLNAGPLLWKITPGNGAKPSWLMGTMHVTDTRVATLPEETKAKIAASRVIALELREILDKQAMQAKMMQDLVRTRMPQGQTLWDAVPDDKEDLIRRNPVIAMAPPELIAQFQPWLVSTQLAVPLCEILRMPHKFSLDQAIAQRAQISGVEVVGLETIEEQLGVMSGMPIADQVEMLLQQASFKVPVEDIFQTSVELYLSRNVSAMMPLLKHLSAEAGFPMDKRGEAFMRELIDKRNITTADRAAPLINKGAAFIAVGALHLPGEVGVIELLRKKGFKVEAGE